LNFGEDTLLSECRETRIPYRAGVHPRFADRGAGRIRPHLDRAFAADRRRVAVDEAHKISETVALRLLLEGRWNDPLWFAEKVDRANPPLGKYVFGAAVLLSGQELPRQRSLSYLARPVMPPQTGGQESRPYLPLRTACRRAALAATALTAALVAFLAARLQGIVASLLAVAWLGRHWMTVELGTSAIFDPLLAVLVFATGAVLFPLLARPRLAMWLALPAGLVCAAAFQTRLSGGIALAAALVLYAAVAVREHSLRIAAAALLMTLVFAVASIAMNSYYWAPNDSSESLAGAVGGDDHHRHRALASPPVGALPHAGPAVHRPLRRHRLCRART
jgi:hypothetical protein